MLRIQKNWMPNGSHCADVNVSDEVLDQSAEASEWMAVSFALLFYLIVLVLSVLAAGFDRFCKKLLSLEATSILFLVGAIMVSVQIFTNENDMRLKMYYRIAAGSAIGIVYVVVGALAFFQEPPGCTAACRPTANQPCSVRHHEMSRRTLGTQQPSMGLVVTGITAPLLIIELFLVLGAQAETGTESNGYKLLWDFIIADKSIYMVQKFIQVIIYVFLRNRIIRENRVSDVQFYFKVLAFFNVAEWLDCVVNADSDLQLSKAERVYGPAFEIIETLYKALVIDYRLLCALLFLEHALDAADAKNDDPQAVVTHEIYGDSSLLPGSNSQQISVQIMTPKDRQKRTAGYVVGSLCIFAQVFCLVGDLPKLEVGPWVNVFATIVDVVLVTCGIWLISVNDMTAHVNKKHVSKGIVIMVCCLGAVGMTDYFMKSTLSGFWSVHSDINSQAPAYFGWVSFKFAVRGVVTAFLMFLFTKVNGADIITDDENRTAMSKMNHFLVPMLMLGIFSEFVGSAIDQYAGPLDTRLRCDIKESSLALLFEAGPPMHLGFCIHVFLQFLIMQRRLGRGREVLAPPPRQKEEDDVNTPLLGSAVLYHVVEQDSEPDA